MLIKGILGIGNLKVGSEMTVIEHLEEFRIRLIRCVLTVLLLTAIAFVCKDFIFNSLILGPGKEDFWTYRMLCKMGNYFCINKLNFILQNRTMGGQFYIHMTTSFMVGLVGSVPYIIWEVWQYIKPAIEKEFRFLTYTLVANVTLLLIAGVLFGYYILSPLSINFLANYTLDQSISNQIDINSYIDMVTMLVLGCALIFQLPVLVYVLSKVGILTPLLMKTYRKHAVVVILIIAAIITPPDVISQVIVSLPLLILYEISIFISSSVTKKSKKLI